jgi:hypothetical protein
LIFAPWINRARNHPKASNPFIEAPAVRFLVTPRSARKLKTKDIEAIKALMHAGELPVHTCHVLATGDLARGEACLT